MAALDLCSWKSLLFLDSYLMQYDCTDRGITRESGVMESESVETLRLCFYVGTLVSRFALCKSFALAGVQ